MWSFERCFMNEKMTSIQVTVENREDIKELAKLLGDRLGFKVGQRVAVMIAVNNMLNKG